MKKSILICAIVAALGACSGGHRFDDELGRADSLMSSRPDSAWAILNALDSAGVQGQRRGTRMRYELLRAEAQNKLYIDFTTDSVMRQVVRYYDRHGSKNEQLKAHYLLGCCYRDMHEAPVALLTWEDAVACADTTAIDCDYATLYRIYGQMAEIYFRQYMPEKELAAREKICHYALWSGDTLYYIRGLLRRNDAFLALGDTTSVFDNIEHVRQLYLERGLTKEAAQVYSYAILIAVKRGEYKWARKMMDVFEQESGLFDSEGNIAATREIYYYHKGMYYLGIHQQDSAEALFRRLLGFKQNVINAYHGLFSTYKHRDDVDSVFKYSTLYERALATYLEDTKTNAIAQAEGMYDYQRQEKIAQQEESRNRRLKNLTLSIIAIFAAALFYLWKRARAKARAMSEMRQSYLQKEEDLKNARAELRYLKDSLLDNADSKEVISQLEDRIHGLERQLKADAKVLGKLDVIEREKRLMNDETVQLFQRICHPCKEDSDAMILQNPPRKALKKEWEALKRAIKREHLSCYIAIESNNHLTPQEKEVAYLSRIDLQTQEMATIIGSSSQSVSNARSSISRKMFSSEDTYKMNRELKDL